MMRLDSEYNSKEQATLFFSKHLQDYQKMLGKAKTDKEKIATIIVFISVLEASHYFSNGNNRMFCQMLINKLLIENKLPQTILYIPNGFSRYALGILPPEVKLGIVGVADFPISTLTECLEPALMMVKEGQEFFATCQEMQQTNLNIN